jgi:error-prone DNA polymerase
MTSFVHLHVASAFSAHYGVTRPEIMVEAARAMGFDALAITDRNGLYGAVKHIGACVQLGLDPIVGVELEVLDFGKSLGRVTLLCHGQTKGLGWSVLCQVVSAAAKQNKQAAVAIERRTLAKLMQQGGGTILLGPQSNLGDSPQAGSSSSIESQLSEWLQLFKRPGSLAIEVVSHLTEPKSRFSTAQAKLFLQLADSHKVPAVLTNAVRYLEPDDALTADVLDSARHLEPLGFFEPQPNAQAWLKPTSLMQELAAEICDTKERAQQLLTTTARLADRCRLDPVSDCDWGRPKTPEKSILGIDGNPFEVLWQKAHAGIDRYYPGANSSLKNQVLHRLSKELITVNQLGFATYFLTVADVAQMIRDMGIRSQARGSGAGSLLNYLIGISGVDPIEHDLLFERFLSTERSSLPDIDIDVESARRHDIYRAVFKRYGSSRVTLLSMQSKYQGRGAMRDSGMAMGLAEDQIDEIAKSMWRFSARSFRGALAVKPELADFAAAVETDRKMNLLVDITERLDRLPRHISMHPCGVILGDSNLLNLTPVEISGMGLPMSQFDKDDMDPMGFLKLDILGVRMQSAMAYAVREAQRVSGITIDLDNVPRDDAATFKAIRTTNTLGIFQIESPGQRELTGKHQPTEFNDLTIQISLFRPGPMKGNMIAPYLDGRHGFAKADYIHPDLEPILKETFGVVIFHEHVIRILHTMTKCSLAKADEMRRSLEKPRIKPEIEKFFRVESAKNGYSNEVIQKVWNVIEGFSSFGFCKAHGAAFALPTYQSAWLKTHYPTEFMAGLFTHDPGMYPKRLLLAEARRLGVSILPIDVNRSSNEYRTEKTEHGVGVRMALTDIQGISDAEVERIIAEQPFVDLPDFYLRAKPSRRSLEHLATVGAFDSLVGLSTSADPLSRGNILARVRQLNAIKTRPKSLASQTVLDFSVLDSLPTGNPDLSSVERVEAEIAITKLDISGHILDSFKPMLDEMGVIRSDELVGLRSKTDVLVAGVRVATQTPPMRSGKRVVFLTLDDGHGCSDATFFEEAQQRSSRILFNNKLLLVSGKTRRTGVKGVSIMAENAWDLRDLWSQWVKQKEAGVSYSERIA